MAVKRKCERLARLFSGAEKVFACGSLASAIHAQTACASVDGLEEAERGFALGLLARLDVGDDDAPGARESMALSAIEPAPKVLARKRTRHSLRDAPHADCKALSIARFTSSSDTSAREAAKRLAASPDGAASMLAPAAMEASRMVRWAASSVGNRA